MPVLKMLRLLIFSAILFSDIRAQTAKLETVQSTVPDGTLSEGSSENITHISAEKLNGHLESETLEVVPNRRREGKAQENDAEVAPDSIVISGNSYPTDSTEAGDYYGSENISEGSLPVSSSIAFDETYNGREIVTKDSTDGSRHYDASTSGDFVAIRGQGSGITRDQDSPFSEKYSYKDDERFSTEANDGDIFTISDTQEENDKSLFELNDPTDSDLFKHEDITTMSYNYNSDLLRETEELLSKKSTESSDNVSNNAEYNNIDTKHRFNTTIEAKNGKEDESNNGDIVPEEVIKKSFSKIGNREIGVSSNYESPQLPVTLDSTSPNFYGVEYIDSSTTFRVSDIQENDNGKTISSNFGSGIPDSKKYEADIDSTESALISAVNDYNAATENDGVVLTSTYEQTTSPQSTEEILKQDVSDTIETNINNEHSDLTLEKISNRRHNLTITETRENKENPIQSSSVFIVNEDYAITTETNINNEHLEFTPEDISNRRHNLAIIKTKTLEKSNENVDGGIPRSQNKEGTIESSLVSPINEDYTVTEKNGTVLTLPYEKPTSEQSIAEIFKQDVSEIPTILSWLPAVENSTTENDTTEANINKEHSDSILEEISDRRHNLTVIRTGTLEKSNENFDDGVSNSEKDSIRSASMSAVNENNAVTENEGVVLTSIYEQPTTQQSTAIVFKQEVTENSTILSRSIASDHSETENDTIETSSNNEHEKPNSQQFSAGVFKQDNPTILSWPTTVEDFTTESSTNTEHSAVTFEEINDRRHNLTIIRDETFEKNKENEITWNSFDSGVATKIKIYENNETSEDVQENTTLVDNLGREVVHTFDKPLTKNSEEATWTTNIVHPITASNDDTTEESKENISTTVKIIQAGKENISNNSDTTDEDEIPQYSFPTEKEEIDYMETTTSILTEEIINHFANKYEESTTEELILITKIDNDDNNGLKNNETEEDLSKKGEDYEATRATPYEVNSKAYDFNEKEETDSMESTEISTEKIMSTTEDDSKIYRDENNENNDNVVKSSEAVVEGNGLLAENHENFNIVNQINLKEINESTSKRTETLIEEVDSATLTQAEINNFTDIRDSTTETVISTTEIESKTSTEALSSEDFSKITGDNIENFNDITTINKLGTITSEQFQDSSEENYSYFNENEEIDSVESTRRVPTNEKPTHFRNSINESATDEIISTTEFDTEISTKALINEDFSKVTENVIETFSEVTVKNKVDIVTTETFLDSNTYNYLYSNKEEKIDLVENTSILIKEEITDHSTVSIKDSTTEEITSTIETGSEIYTETVNNDNLSKVTENIVRSITDMTVQNKVDMVKTEESTVQTTEAFTFNIAGNADKVTNPIFSESESAETTTENNLREPVTSSTDKVNDPVENNFTYVVHATGAIKTTTIPSLDDIEVEVAIENTINDIRNATRTLVTALTVEEETEGTEDYSSDRITHIRDHLEESSESDIEFEAAKEKILKDINNITRTLVTALRAEEETEETENDSSDTVTRDYSEESLESEDYSTAISSSEEEQEEEENDMNLNVLDAFLSNLIPASKTTVDPTSVSDQNGYDQETENGVERLHANVFGNQANVTIKIEVKGASFYIPFDAYFNQDLDKLILNITWISHHKLVNNSLSLILAENPKVYAIKQIQLSLVQGNKFEIWNHPFTTPLSGDPETTFSIVFRDNVRVTISNLRFLKVKNAEIRSNDIESMTSEIRIEKKAAGIVAGCIGAALLVCAVLYLVITRTRKRTLNIENLTKHDIP